MVNNQELFKRRGDGGPDELFWEESDNIYGDVKNELLEHHKPVLIQTLIFKHSNLIITAVWLVSHKLPKYM